MIEPNELMTQLVETLELENKDFQSKIEKNLLVINALRERLGNFDNTANSDDEQHKVIDKSTLPLMTDSEQNVIQGSRFAGKKLVEVVTTLFSEAHNHALYVDDILEIARKENFEIKPGSLRSLLSLDPNFKSFGNSLWGLASSPHANSRVIKMGRGNTYLPPINETLLKPSEAESLTKVDCIEIILRRAPRPLDTQEIIEQLKRAGKPVSGADSQTQRANIWTTVTRKRYKDLFYSPSRGKWTVHNPKAASVGVLDFEDKNEDEQEQQEVVLDREENLENNDNLAT